MRLKLLVALGAARAGIVVEMPDELAVLSKVFDVNVRALTVWLVDVCDVENDLESRSDRTVGFWEPVCDAEEP